MLTSLPLRKAKVSLSDYPYRRDIENRLIMAQLTVLEVNVLQEIIHHSLTISVKQLAEDLGISVDKLLPILDKLGETKLFKRQQLTLSVDKDMRKYFEFQMEKFDENFKPDLDFLQNVLNKVPIHVLPLWYAIPRSSDNIFDSIVEKYFLTPKIYRQYLSELEFDNPLLKSMIQDVYRAPNFTLPATELMNKYNLTREVLEESVLLLEYYFACCLSYRRVDEEWQEIVTPFAEWMEYLQFEEQAKVKPLRGLMTKGYYTDFNFINDMNAILQACQRKKIVADQVENLHAKTPVQLETVVNKLIQVGFAKQQGHAQLLATEKGKAWLLKSFSEQIAHLASDPLNVLANGDEFSSLWNMRHLNLIEKSLHDLPPNQWIELPRFLQGFMEPLGDKEPVILKNKGKKWKYVLPTYTPQEKQFIEVVIMERLAQLGIVATGHYKGQPCFCLTPFGSHLIH